LLRCAGALLLCCCPAACAPPAPPLPEEETIVVPAEGSVVVYVEAPRRSARPLLKMFEEQSGIKVSAVYKEELGERFYEVLRAEAVARRVDLFWGTSPLTAIALQRAELTTPFRTVAARSIPGQYHDPGFHWTGFAVNPRVIIFNDQRVERSQAPRSIEDFNRLPWGGKGAIARIARGAPAFQAAALFSLWGTERGRKFFDTVRASGNRIVEEDRDVLQAVTAGESLWGIIDLDQAICARRRNEPVHIFFPDRLSLGAIVPPWVAVLLRGAPNMAQAKGLFGFLFATDSAWQLGQYDCALMTLLPDIPKPEWVPVLGGVNVTQINNQAAYDAFVDNTAYFMSWGAPAGEPTEDP
jgi:iron(III) transport system substrate-binding protein